MQNKFSTLLTLIFSMALATDYATARPSPEVGARRPGPRISAADLHTCAIEEDGTLSCWSNNGNDGPRRPGNCAYLCR